MRDGTPMYRLAYSFRGDGSQIAQPPILGSSKQPDQGEGDTEVQNRSDTVGDKWEVIVRRRAPRHLEDIRHRRSRGKGGRMKHQYHFVAVRWRSAAQRRRQDNTPIKCVVR